jgi:cytochrome P450
MFVLIPALHRDPVWGRDVDRFDPDRFLRDRVAARPAHAYKPFGSGVRACIGRQFALHQIALVIGTLIRRYEMRSDPAYCLRIQEALTMRPAGFALDLAPRKESADDRRRSLP